MIQITEPITLEKILPLVQQLPKVEREQLRKVLENDPVSWEEEWERITAHFRTAFANVPEDEVERDLSEALAEVRREQT